MRTMFAAPSPFDIEDAPATRLRPVRVAGGVRVRIETRGGRGYAADVLERDGYKVRFPRGAAQLEAIIINTGGGLVGGDAVSQEIRIGDGAEATVATQASERVYRALGEAATTVDVRLSAGAEAHLNWLPQETIIFDRARLQRSIEADITASSRLLIAETVVFGRTAMGETVRQGQFLDRWRIRVDGKLVFAETARLEGEIAETLAMPAIAAGAHVVSTVLAVREDAEDLLEQVRGALEDAGCETGASAWGRVLVVRSLGRSGENLRRTLGRVIPILSGAPLPRVWQT
jgi:urease accessory protein